MIRSFSLSWLFSFFKRCPSSTIIVVHTSLRRKKFTSLTSISYVVTTMSNSDKSLISSALMRLRSPFGPRNHREHQLLLLLVYKSTDPNASLIPWKRTALREGQNLSISISQFDSTESGTMTRCGPRLLSEWWRYAIKPIDWRVLPKPIWSPRIIGMPFWNICTIQLIPWIWCVCNSATVEM